MRSTSRTCIKYFTVFLAAIAALPITPVVLIVVALFTGTAQADPVYDVCDRTVRNAYSGISDQKLIREKIQMCWYAKRLRSQKMRGYGGDPNVLSKKPPVPIQGGHWVSFEDEIKPKLIE